jgi:hypothetical protein
MIYSPTILINRCDEGIYLRWWFNGWHYFLFSNGYEITMRTESMDTQVTNMFSLISKIEHPTKQKADYSYQITLEGITAGNVPGFTGLLLAEKVEQYEGSKWYEIEITRGEHLIKDENAPGYILDFEITRKELPHTPSVFQKSIKLYLDDTLCDLDEDEVIPVNKQTNDIAEMQDRQSDFTAQFKIRKTRAMRALFELSGEVGANTTFPYENQSCRLIQDNIEMITGGILMLDKVDDQYYYVSIYSGNLNFFKAIDKLKIGDLTSGSPDPLEHTWDIATQKITHDASPETDYAYPLCEPSDDSAMNPDRLAGNTTELYGGWIWPFIKVETLWNELFLNAGFTCEGDILSNDTFLKLHLPIASLKVSKAQSDKYLYSVYWVGSVNSSVVLPYGWAGAILINGDLNFQQGHYRTPYSASYKFHISTSQGTILTVPPDVYLYSGVTNVGTFTFLIKNIAICEFELTYDAVAGEDLTFWVHSHFTFSYYMIAVVEINNATIAYGSVVDSRQYLPDITQIDFIKLICNMFGLIPEVTPRDRKILFWNFSKLYENIPNARDWSAYLSEREDETEFKFGDYAQSNYLKYKECSDVIKDNGKGTLLVNDETLQLEKDILTLSIATCDEVTVAYTAPTVNMSRIAMNKWDGNSNAYKANETIDPRIVYIKRATGKTLVLWDTAAMNVNSVTVNDPRVATSIDVSFSYLVTNYAWLSRMLTKTNLRRAKFNLPVYEVAGLKHYVPIYLKQYKAYFYVNKINNYVPGKLCIIDLIKL